jgi:hypothetical protein
MTILASRQHTCIHPQVSKMSNKDELCKNMRKNEMPRNDVMPKPNDVIEIKN